MTTILLVEDNADMLTMLTQVLEWGGYNVVSGRSGQEGLNVLNKSESLPNLIISDISMPDLDGIAFLQAVRGHVHWTNIPFIIMSAKSSQEELRNARNHGANDYIVKPFNLDDFQKLLNKWENFNS